MKIPLGKPYIKTEVALEAIKEVLDSRWISGGPKINEFEEKIKEYNNDSEGHYIAVSNGTVAIISSDVSDFFFRLSANILLI